MHGGSGRRGYRDRDSHAPWFTFRLFQIGALRRRDLVRVAQRCSCGDVEERCAVAHRPGDSVLSNKPGDEVAVIGPERVPCARGLEPEYPAARCGDPDRSTAVAGMCHWDDARSDRCRRPAAGPTRTPIPAPRVPGWAKPQRLGSAQDPKLGHVGLANHHQPYASEPGDEFAVLAGNELAE